MIPVGTYREYTTLPDSWPKKFCCTTMIPDQGSSVFALHHSPLEGELRKPSRQAPAEAGGGIRDGRSLKSGGSAKCLTLALK